MAPSVEGRIALGAAWMVGFKLLDRSIGVVSLVILARLLAPSDFGLVAMATAVIALVELLSSFSFDVALIQNRDAPRAHYDTAWSLNIIMASMCALVVAAAAFPVAAFYAEPRLAPIMLWLSLGTWIRGFENVGVVAFRKELEFNREFRLLLAKRVAVFLATISAALATRSYWALVAGSLAGSLIGVMLSYLLHAFRPRFDLSARDTLLRFSKWLVLGNVLQTIANRLPDPIIGKALGPGPLGLFNLAHEIANLPTTELSAPINRAVFPGYARVAFDPVRLRAQYLKVQGLTTLATAPAAIGVAAIAPLLVPLLLGDAWRGAVPLIEVLALSGLLASLRTNAGYVFLAAGRPGLASGIVAIRVAISLPSVLIGTIYFGIHGAAWSMLATSVLALPVTHLLVNRVLRVSWMEYAAILWRPLVAAGCMSWLLRSCMEWSAHDLSAVTTLVSLALAIVLGAVAYVAIVWLLWVGAGLPESAESSVRGAVAQGLRRWRTRER